MNKHDYLQELTAHLASLSEQERSDVLEYFTEYFEDAPDEETAISNLGSPADAAQDILEKMGKKDAAGDTRSSHFGDFLKKFLTTFTATDQNWITTEPRLLPDLTSLQLDLEDSNVTVIGTTDTQASLQFELKKELADDQLPYRLENGVLTLLADQTGLVHKVTVSVPNQLRLSKVTGKVDDSNLNLRSVLVDQFELDCEDSNLNITDNHIEQLKLDLEDCNLNLRINQLATAAIQAEDSNLNLRNGAIATALNMKLEDCNLNLHRSQTDQDILLVAYDSLCRLPAGFVKTGQDPDRFASNPANQDARVTIQVEDSMVNIK